MYNRSATSVRKYEVERGKKGEKQVSFFFWSYGRFYVVGLSLSPNMFVKVMDELTRHA